MKIKTNNDTTFYAIVVDRKSIMTDFIDGSLNVYVSESLAQVKLNILKASYPDLDFKIEKCEIELLGEI